jgi:hypothetical protein
LGNPVPCPAVIARADCYQKHGGFETRLPFAADLEMWLRLAVGSDIGYLVAQLVTLRVHPDQETARFSSSGRDYQDILTALDLVFSRDLPPDCSQYASQAYFTLARQSQRMLRWQLTQGNIAPAFRYAMIALVSATRALRGN